MRSTSAPESSHQCLDSRLFERDGARRRRGRRARSKRPRSKSRGLLRARRIVLLELGDCDRFQGHWSSGVSGSKRRWWASLGYGCNTDDGSLWRLRLYVGNRANWVRCSIRAEMACRVPNHFHWARSSWFLFIHPCAPILLILSFLSNTTRYTRGKGQLAWQRGALCHRPDSRIRRIACQWLLIWSREYVIAKICRGKGSVLAPRAPPGLAPSHFSKARFAAFP